MAQQTPAPTRRAGVSRFLIVLGVVVAVGIVAQVVGGSAPQHAADAASATATPAATPKPLDSPEGRAAVAVVARVQRAFNAGDVGTLCKPGALVDPAVVRHQDATAGGCESQVEVLVAQESPLRLTVRDATLRPDLVTAVVATRAGSTVPVDFVRGPRGWLLSFSDGEDPLPALAGTT
jgi:hypothetical protein